MEPAIVWKDIQTWNPLIVEILTSELAATVRERLKERDTSEYYIDDPAWVTLLSEVSGLSVEDLIFKLARKLSSRNVRAYHGCRPLSITSYTSRGILIHRQEELTEELRELVQSDPRLSPVDLDVEIPKYPRDYDRGKSFFTFDDRMMIEYAGQYLIYGSEWIAVVLGAKLRYVLRERGTPTILLIDLPGNLIPFEILEGLAKDLLLEWSKHATRESATVHLKDFGVVLEQDLDAKYIVGHEHPDQIKDPWEGRVLYIVENKCCAADQ